MKLVKQVCSLEQAKTGTKHPARGSRRNQTVKKSKRVASRPPSSQVDGLKQENERLRKAANKSLERHGAVSYKMVINRRTKTKGGTMTHFEIVMKLIGKVQPVGETKA